MAREIKSTDSLVGTLILYTDAVKVAPWVFLGRDAQEIKPAPSSEWPSA